MSSASKKAKQPQIVPQKPATFIHYCFYALFFITPLLLWPFTYEVFEFNKMLFVYAMTVIIAAGWAVRTIKQKRFEIARTPLDLPILLFLTSQIISTIFSIDSHTSLWGYYSRFHGGLVSTICYLILFYALVTHFSGQTKAIKRLIRAIFATAAITAFYAVLERMGIDKHIWVQDVQSRVFSTLGQPNWLSAYLIAMLPLSLFAAARARDLSYRIVHVCLSTLLLTAILFTRSQSGMGATAVILISFVIMITIQKKQRKILLGFIALLIVGLIFKGGSVRSTLTSLNKINPFYSDTQTIVTEENKTRLGGSDSMTIRRIVWTGAIELGKRYPFFGTGVETFGYSYYWVRPAAHNLTSEADFLYNKAHNEYLNFLANTGLVGLGTYLFLIGSIIYLFLKNKEVEFSSPLLLGFISILITNYFGFSVVNVALFFFLFPAILLAATGKTKIYSGQMKINEIFGIAVVIILSLWLLSGVRRLLAADLAYNAGKSNLTENLKAIKLNPSEPLYYAQLGNIQSLVATQIVAPQIKEMTASTPADLRQKANFYLDQYIQDALKNISLAVSMNKYNLNLLKTKARTELTLATLDPKYNQDAIQTLLKISELSPTDSSNFYHIGILYSQMGRNEESRMAFQKALELRPDYQAAKDYLGTLK